MIHVGDCLEVMRAMADGSVDAIVTDPPYGLAFMGKKWDYDVPTTEVWAECLRVLKPGGHLLAFASTRTQHRMAARIGDAGFEIRDMIAWVYGSGFPKSHNGPWGGTALKPALEPITIARKPLSGTVKANWGAYGTGALNIHGCRVSTDENLNGGAYAKEGGRSESSSLHAGSGMNQPGKTAGREFEQPAGRWPANLIHDGSGEVLAHFPISASGAMKSGTRRAAQETPGTVCYGTFGGNITDGDIGSSTGSAARFFYCAKATREDRNDGLEAGPVPAVTAGATMRDRETADWAARNGNHHPTVKPTDLMRYLCRLVTPAGGTVLDPFMGSGSTGKAAILEGFQFVGIELDPIYAAIAEARIRVAQPGLALGDVA